MLGRASGSGEGSRSIEPPDRAVLEVELGSVCGSPRCGTSYEGFG